MNCLNHKDKNFYIDIFEELKRIIESKGFTLQNNYDDLLENNTAGRIFYHNDVPPNIILLNIDCYFCKIMTIFHEIGHMLYYFKRKKNLKNTSSIIREKQAYRLGWGKICNMNLNNIITYQDWKYFHNKIN